jgi:arsenite methyltransferase
LKSPDYGLDAPGLVFRFLIGGAALALAGVLASRWSFVAAHGVAGLGRAATWMGSSFALTGLLMAASSRYGKQVARDRLLDGLRLAGDERVLDVGCGRGLLLIGAAQRVPRGMAVGIDLWSLDDLSGNRPRATLENAELEGVRDRVEVHDGDMRKMPFPDQSFDAVVASLSIHNIYDRAGRRQAIHEIARVLKPGGRVALQDFQHVVAYAEDLAAEGLQAVRVSGLKAWIFPPVRVVTAQR